MGQVDPVAVVQAEVMRADAVTHQTVAREMMWLFGICNLAVLVIIGVMIAQDPGLLHAKPIRAKERAVSATVLLALIAGTTTQLGAMALIIGKYLFPGKGGD